MRGTLFSCLAAIIVLSLNAGPLRAQLVSQAGEEPPIERLAPRSEGESGEVQSLPQTREVPRGSSGCRGELEGSLFIYACDDGSRASLALPCEGLGFFVHDEIAHVACGDSGIALVSLADVSRLSLLGFREMGGFVSGFFSVRGQVWAEIQRFEARPVLSVPISSWRPSVDMLRPTPATPTQPMAQPDQVASRSVGQIVELRSGEVVVALGTTHGVQRTDHIELFVEHEVSLGLGQLTIAEERLAVGEVTAVTEERAQVRLGMNEQLPPNAMARQTHLDLTSDRWLPPRMANIWEVGFTARPFLALGTLGFGALADVEVNYRFAEPVVVGAILNPIGVGLAEEGNIITFAGNGFVAYDTRAFQVGLGLGYIAVNDELGGTDYATDRDGTIDLQFDEVKHGLSISQIARLGARDGLHMQIFNTFILIDGEFIYGGTLVSNQVPLPTTGTRTWLILRGGGGLAGYAFGEVGLRVLLRGNGDRGSLFVTPTIGGAYIQGKSEGPCDPYYTINNEDSGSTTCTETIGYGGPAVGFGMEWRF